MLLFVVTRGAGEYWRDANMLASISSSASLNGIIRLALRNCPHFGFGIGFFGSNVEKFARYCESSALRALAT